jgi:hypothetical protein
MPIPGAAFAARGGFKLGKFLVNQGRAAWGRAKESGFKLTTGDTFMSRKAEGTATATTAPRVADAEAYARAMRDAGSPIDGSTMDYMKYAPYAIGAILLLMMKK